MIIDVKMKICATDCRLPLSCRRGLESRGFEVLPLPPLPSLPSPAASHADLLIFYVCGTLVTRNKYYEIAGNSIDRIVYETGCRLVLTDDEAGGEYPLDTPFCAAPAGKYLICRTSSVSSAVLRVAGENGLIPLNVKQGYSRCSCAPLADGSIITSDRGISRRTSQSGIDVLEIVPGHISLPGYKTGFIGGCCGLYGDTLYFAGDISVHPDSDKITYFAAAHGTRIVSLSDEPLYDVGGLFFFGR